jgi:hypothetical protein
MPKRFHFISLVPLGFAALELVWTFILIVAVAEAKGKLSQTRSQTHTIDALGMIPAVIGVIAAIVIMIRSQLTIIDRIVVIIGVLACLPLLYAFGKELMTP